VATVVEGDASLDLWECCDIAATCRLGRYMKPIEQTPAWRAGQPKLLDRVRVRCRVRHLSLSTEHAYVGRVPSLERLGYGRSSLRD
jgi:hypothetical protein